MVFNGHTEQYIESLDEELFTEIQVMYADGLLGNKGIFDALTPITTAVYNYFRSAQSPTIQAADIFPWVQEYSINPDTVPTQEEQTNNALLMFMSQAQGFKPELFKK